jgi:hypothetical protein
MRDNHRTAVLALAVSIAALAVAVVVRGGPAAAQQQPASYGGGGTSSSNNRYLAVTGSVGSGMSVLWLVDTEGKRVLIYGTNSLGKNVELRAARNIEWDLRLDDYMDESQWKAEDLKRLAERQHGGPVAPKEKEPQAPPEKGPK